MKLAVRINLLDWRAAEREYKRKRFIAQLMTSAIMTVLVVGVLPVLYYDHLIATQRMRNHYLQGQITIADHKLAEARKLKKARGHLVKRMQVIDQLQHSRSASVHYFDQIAATIPDGVTLSRLDQAGAVTTLEGVAETNAQVSQYMANLGGSPWFTDPQLIVIKRNENGRADFTLKFDSVTPGNYSDTPLAGVSTGPTSSHT